MEMIEQEKEPTARPKNPLTNQPIGQLIRQIGVPVGVGVFFNTMFNVVDTYYAGSISDEALAALSLSFPVYFIIIALAFGLSTGNTALIGNALGADDKEAAEGYAVQGFTFGAVLSLGVTLIGILVSPPLFRLLGATDEYLALSLSYINPIFYGSIFFVISQMLNSVLNALGNTKPFRNFLIGGFLLNLVLDPWFIFGGFGLPAMGIFGIAIATVFVQFLGSLYLGYEVYKTGFITRDGLMGNLRPQATTILDITKQGLPNMIDLGSVSIGFFILTFFVSRFGQAAVAAFGAASRIEQLALLPTIGLDVAAVSLTAQNNGAGFIGRVRETLFTSARYGLIIMAVGATLIFIFAEGLMGLFSNNAEIIEIGADYIRIKAWALPPVGVYFVANAVLRGLKMPQYPLAFNLFRMIIIPAAGIYLFVEQLGFGVNAIWWVALVAYAGPSFFSWFIAKRKIELSQQEAVKNTQGNLAALSPSE